ncbi:MAG TPA: tetratricopeptide repeat protein [Chitinophagales bacterium]|nr:tetratricopeptide repeat protein [Chitinophagales bacterium]MCB9074101.1 tetratricopeptide repeat protein [Chitinophagales bacterium]HMU97312.1 tetratricopeptide repeat protein [Chitinophagales bacterium]HMV01837.1 tetratricopeptide repeat protein [Chitinophagales bacterium]HMW93786.1 tetratricopeptide repeat protein [Chitinophagales bacterium]
MKKEELKKYLEQTLSDKERNALEQEMQDNPFLNEATEGLEAWTQQGNADFDALENELNKNIDDKIDSKNLEIKKVVRMPIFRIIAVAAGIIGILFLTVTYLHQQRMETEALFEANFKVLTQIDGAVRGEDAEIESNMNEEKKAVYYYERENYKEAIVHYEKALQSQPDNNQMQLYLAVAYLANYQATDAIQILSENDFSNSQYKQDRNWYLALAYLKNKDLKNAKPLFEQLSAFDNYYQNSSKKLLKSLEGKVL